MRFDISRCSLTLADIHARAQTQPSLDVGASLSPLLEAWAAWLSLTRFGMVGLLSHIWVIGHAFGRIHVMAREVPPDTYGH